jgi:hypothetical protein
MTDTDNVWAGNNQKAGVDAQYYAALTDEYYVSERGFDLPACLGVPIQSIVHYSNSYDNAFWDSSSMVMVYGDGNGTTDGPFSGAQDVVSHELSHAVTSCRASLDYVKQSGALNEAFSDIMATAAEFELLEPNLSNCLREASQATCADWWIAEDAIIGGTDHAFRSMAKPGLLGQPSHNGDAVYLGAKSCAAFNDQCGVHYNSGIANHAFYLMVNGGRNARCSGPTDPQADCDVLVPGIEIDDAAHIFFDAWQGLTSGATFCQARDMTVAITDILFPSDDWHYAAADLAWQAVGVGRCPNGATFDVAAASRSTVAKAGGTADIALEVSPPTALTYTATSTAPATVTFPSGSIHFDVDGDAAPGTYSVTITASDGAVTQQVPIVLIVDSDEPSATVTGVQLALGSTVAADGHAPLAVSWTATDATSGVAGTTLVVDSAPLGSGASPFAYSATDGTHLFQITATDFAGNSATSPPVSVTRTSFQENAATYKKAWTAATSGTPWGSTRFSKKKGATAVLTFSGTDVAWVSSRAPKRGKAKVYIDGVKMAVVDLKSSATQSRVIVYVASGLAPGQHTIKVFVNGTAGRPRVDVDGFIVLSN